MTTYDDVASEEILPNKPLSSSIVSRLRDNPLASLEGDPTTYPSTRNGPDGSTPGTNEDDLDLRCRLPWGAQAVTNADSGVAENNTSNVLIPDGQGGVKWANINSVGTRYSFMAYGFYQAASVNSNTIFILSSEDHDTGSWYNASNGLITAPVTGDYHFSTTGYFAIGDTGVSNNNGLYVAIFKDGVNIIKMSSSVSLGSVAKIRVDASVNLRLGAGQTVGIGCVFINTNVVNIQYGEGAAPLIATFSGHLIGAV